MSRSLLELLYPGRTGAQIALVEPDPQPRRAPSGVFEPLLECACRLDVDLGVTDSPFAKGVLAALNGAERGYQPGFGMSSRPELIR